MNLVEKVEAILYASENPLSINDLAMVLGEDKDAVADALKNLMKDYRKRITSLNIVRTGIRYKLQLKNEYSDLVTPVSQREIGSLELRILGFIAANSECKRGDVLQHFGERARTPLDQLVNRKFLHSEKYRNTELFTVTKDFYRYFNIGKKDLEKRYREAGEEAPNE